MAKDDTRQLILLGVGAYAFYRLSLEGVFGSGALAWANKLQTNLNKPSAPSAPTKSNTPSPGAAIDYTFIPGQRYVDYDPAAGRYFVYWYGTVTYYGSQSEAEAAYNRMVEAQANTARGGGGGGSYRAV